MSRRNKPGIGSSVASQPALVAAQVSAQPQTAPDVGRHTTAQPAAAQAPQNKPERQQGAALPPMTDAQIIAAIMQNSLRTYPGNCPCPENTMANGRRCGGNTAWSRPGGYKPISYPREVTRAMVEAYRRSGRGS
jgi:choline dehydrogenase-like flavoprotein